MTQAMIIIILYSIPAFVIAISVHEFSHALAAYLYGDNTAKEKGRLTLNPIKHLDPFGSIMIILTMITQQGIGWGKPVPVNPVNFKNRRMGNLVTSLAGPLSNLIMAFLAAFPMLIIANQQGFDPKYLQSLANNNFAVVTAYNFCWILFTVNIGFAIFNLLPIPPLDGSGILVSLLPEKQRFLFLKYENYLSIGLVALVFFMPGVLSFILSPTAEFIKNSIRFIVGPIVS